MDRTLSSRSECNPKTGHLSVATQSVYPTLSGISTSRFFQAPENGDLCTVSVSECFLRSLALRLR